MSKVINEGDIVRLTNPVDEREAAARFVVAEHRGDRVLIRLICDMRIPPTECVALSEVSPVDTAPARRD